MPRSATYQRIAKCILLSLLCFESVFSATIETVQRLEVDEDGDIFDEDQDILLNDFFRFTTRKRYIWEDYTVPTRDYSDYGGSSSSKDLLFYIFVPIFVALFVVTIVYICKKSVESGNCCSFESDSSLSADRFTTVHRPPERRRDLTAQVHRLPTGMNQVSDSRRELFGEPARPALVNEADRNYGAADTLGGTISFVTSPYASSSYSRTEPENPVAEKPPAYSTVTLNDLIHPTQPAFPLVKKDNETPPPKYSKESPFFK